MGYSQTIHFRELGAFSAVLKNPQCTTPLLAEARSVLRAIFHDEELSVKTAAELFEERKGIIEGLFDQLGDALAAVAEKEGVELPPGMLDGLA